MVAPRLVTLPAKSPPSLGTLVWPRKLASLAQLPGNRQCAEREQTALAVLGCEYCNCNAVLVRLASPLAQSVTVRRGDEDCRISSLRSRRRSLRSSTRRTTLAVTSARSEERFSPPEALASSMEEELKGLIKTNNWGRLYSVSFRAFGPPDIGIHSLCPQDIRRDSVHHDFTTVEASRPQNRHLNRYRDVYPYDHSRVKLRDHSPTDYINASLVKVSARRELGRRSKFDQNLLGTILVQFLVKASAGWNEKR